MIDLLKKRKSVRNYLNREIGKNIVDMLLEAALLSPSSRGTNPWNFIVIDNPEIIRKLSLTKEHGSAFLKDAPLVIAVTGDMAASDVWVEDCSIASIIIQLEAESLGLGSCWVQVRSRKTKSGSSSEDYVRQVLSIPDNFGVEALIGIGYHADAPVSGKKQEPAWEKCRYNSFSTRY